MWLYLAKRLLLSVVIVLMAILVLFSMLHMIPGDPVSIALGPRATPEVQAAYAAKMHLDKPLFYQFLIFIGNVLQGDLGEDVFSGRAVTQTLAEQLPYTIVLAVSALAWSALIGIPLGCFSAIHPNTCQSTIKRFTPCHGSLSATSRIDYAAIQHPCCGQAYSLRDPASSGSCRGCSHHEKERLHS